MVRGVLRGWIERVGCEVVLRRWFESVLRGVVLLST